MRERGARTLSGVPGVPRGVAAGAMAQRGGGRGWRGNDDSRSSRGRNRSGNRRWGWSGHRGGRSRDLIGNILDILEGSPLGCRCSTLEGCT